MSVKCSPYDFEDGIVVKKAPQQFLDTNPYLCTLKKESQNDWPSKPKSSASVKRSTKRRRDTNGNTSRKTRSRPQKRQKPPVINKCYCGNFRHESSPLFSSRPSTVNIDSCYNRWDDREMQYSREAKIKNGHRYLQQSSSRLGDDREMQDLQQGAAKLRVDHEMKKLQQESSKIKDDHGMRNLQQGVNKIRDDHGMRNLQQGASKTRDDHGMQNLQQRASKRRDDYGMQNMQQGASKIRDDHEMPSFHQRGAKLRMNEKVRKPGLKTEDNYTSNTQSQSDQYLQQGCHFKCYCNGSGHENAREKKHTNFFDSCYRRNCPNLEDNYEYQRRNKPRKKRERKIKKSTSNSSSRMKSKKPKHKNYSDDSLAEEMKLLNEELLQLRKEIKKKANQIKNAKYPH